MVEKGISKKTVFILLILVIIISIFSTIKVLDMLSVSEGGSSGNDVAEANVRLTITPQEETTEIMPPEEPGEPV